MRRPEPSWEAIYKNDRRAHRHRCVCCNRIINAGEPVVMCYRSPRGTLAMHAGCANLGENREHLRKWGLSGLKARGWRVPELDTHY